MEAIEAIMTRRSFRRFEEQTPDDVLEKIIRAGMMPVYDLFRGEVRASRREEKR